MKKCYMCRAPATSKEHAPPSSFFPEGYRDNLITVPSCYKHNNDNSQDVEYVRGFIVSPIQTKEPARQHFNNKVLRSLKKSRKLFDRIFKGSERIIVGGRETGLIHIEMGTFCSIMQGIAHAMFFYLNKTQYMGNFQIHCVDLVSSETLPPEVQQNYAKIREMCELIDFNEIRMPQPEIFRLGVDRGSTEKFIYKFVFYGGFKVYALSIPFYYKPLPKK